MKVNETTSHSQSDNEIGVHNPEGETNGEKEEEKSNEGEDMGKKSTKKKNLGDDLNLNKDIEMR